MTLDVSESLARRHLAEGKSEAEKTISIPAMKRKYVQKPSNISEKLWQKLSENGMKVLIYFEQGFIAFKFEKLWCPFRTNPNKSRKRNWVQAECNNVDFFICESYKSRRKWKDDRFY